MILQCLLEDLCAEWLLVAGCRLAPGGQILSLLHGLCPHTLLLPFSTAGDWCVPVCKQAEAYDKGLEQRVTRLEGLVSQLHSQGKQ